MKRLLLLWDPDNPMTRIGPVIEALRRRVELRILSFADVSHRTLPNGMFEVRRWLDAWRADGLVWMEGGPLPADIERCGVPTACWLINAHHEPSLVDDIGARFDRCLVTNLGLRADERCRWLPLCAGNGQPVAPTPGVSLVVDDPKPSHHAIVQRALDGKVQCLATPLRPIAICMGQGSQPHAGVFDHMRSGYVVVTDPDTNLRGLAHPGDHVLVYPSIDELDGFIGDLVGDEEQLDHVTGKASQIVEHLHTPDLRAAQLCEALWPSYRVLSSLESQPRVSVLAVCYKYLKRFRVCLESLARQDMDAGELEVVVADPQSPDGLAGFLEEFADRHPHLRLVHLPLNGRYYRNRGVGINRAFDASRGRVIIGIDGDIIFPAHAVRALADRCEARPQHVHGVWRVLLNETTTRAILDGRIDPWARWDELVEGPTDDQSDGHKGVLGYCQAVERSAFARARYPEEFDMVNQSDIVFVERLSRYADVTPRCVDGCSVLHLWHPRNWQGTSEFL